MDALPWQLAAIDRGSERRLQTGFLDSLVNSPNTKYLAVQDGKTLVRDRQIVFLRDGLPAPAAEQMQRDFVSDYSAWETSSAVKICRMFFLARERRLFTVPSGSFRNAAISGML